MVTGIFLQLSLLQNWLRFNIILYFYIFAVHFLFVGFLIEYIFNYLLNKCTFEILQMADSVDEVTLDCDSYISAAVLTVWDSVEGTRMLRTWRTSHPASKHNYVCKDCIDFVSKHSLISEASRQLVDVESMFYCLNNQNVIAIAFLFSVPSRQKYSDLFSLCIVLPLSELSEWLCRHTLLVKKMKSILKFNLIPNLTRLAKKVNYS